jgi:hypothetical protein
MLSFTRHFCKGVLTLEHSHFGWLLWIRKVCEGWEKRSFGMEVIGGRNALSTSHHLRNATQVSPQTTTYLRCQCAIFATCDQFRLSNFVNPWSCDPDGCLVGTPHQDTKHAIFRRTMPRCVQKYYNHVSESQKPLSSYQALHRLGTSLHMLIVDLESDVEGMTLSAHFWDKQLVIRNFM